MDELELAFLMQQYDKNKILFTRAIDSVKRDIEEYFNDIRAGFIHYIKTRVKTIESIIGKARDKAYTAPFQQMNDIARIRIVCHNESDKDQVIEFIKSRYRGSIEIEEKIKRDDGYKAYHIVVWAQVLLAGQTRKVKVEIQLRTVAEDLFGTLSHRDIYKLSTKLPESWCIKMKDLSDRLEVVDNLAEELKQEWIQGNIRTKTKDQLDAQSVKNICDKYSGGKMSINDAMNCLANLLINDISTISELEETLKDDCTLAEIDKIYLELLGRNADINGKVIHGAFLHKYKTFDQSGRKFLFDLIRNAIKMSPEYLEKRRNEVRFIGKDGK